MNNNNAFQVDEVLKLAECPICCELKTDYRILAACGHSFCLDDLEILAKKHDKCVCPLCRTKFEVPHGGMNTLIKDFHKIALAEIAVKYQDVTGVNDEDVCVECQKKATVWCQEDECGFCDTHVQLAHQYAKSKYHTLVHPSKKIIKVYCPAHKKELEKYCKECEKVICMGM